jgi:hypothetical protein
MAWKLGGPSVAVSRVQRASSMLQSNATLKSTARLAIFVVECCCRPNWRLNPTMAIRKRLSIGKRERKRHPTEVKDVTNLHVALANVIN